jgi:hypothetical protein
MEGLLARTGVNEDGLRRDCSAGEPLRQNTRATIAIMT